MDADHLAAHWSSTGNSLEALAFAAKDVLLLVDDFAPNGTHHDVQRIHRDAERFLRAIGNRAGRQRMRADTSLRPAKPPRAMVVSTGEDVPRGQSLRARMLIVEVPRGAVHLEVLTRLQREAALGKFAAAMAGYIQWLAARYDAIQSTLRDQRLELRATATSETAGHLRTPGIVADLALGLRHYLLYARDSRALTSEEADAIWHRGWTALCAASTSQAQHQAANDPVRRSFELLAAAVASGRAHLAHADGGRPANAAAWGWREDPDGYRARGECIGWVDDQGNIYLEPDAAYAAAQRLAADGGDSLGVTLHTLKTRLHERGFLVSTETRGDKLYRAVRKTLAGKQRSVLHLQADALGPLSHPDVAKVAKADDESGGRVEKPAPAPLPLLGYLVGYLGDGHVAKKVANDTANPDEGGNTLWLPGLPSAPQNEPAQDGGPGAQVRKNRRRPPRPRASDIVELDVPELPHE